MTIVEMMDMFPTELSATEWFESIVWAGERHCGHCGSTTTREVPNAKPMPYWCPHCRHYFSVRTGTAIARSNVPMRKWAIAIYLCLTSLKSLSSMKLHRDLGVSQKTAWFMLHRIREAWALETPGGFTGPVEADEAFFGGKAKNMHRWQRDQLTGRGGVDKMAVIGLKDRATKRVRATVVGKVQAPMLRGYVVKHTEPEATLYTDGEPAHAGRSNHDSVKHSAGEYVRGEVHTNSIESFWSMLKRAHMGTFHKLSPKHLNRYVQEFAAKNDLRDSDTLVQMCETVWRLVGRNLLYRSSLRTTACRAVPGHAL